jgi:hypothetical protein
MSTAEHSRPIEIDGRGNILYGLYGQDGALVPMKCADTPSNRHFVRWIRQHDRYTPRTDCSAPMAAPGGKP